MKLLTYLLICIAAALVIFDLYKDSIFFILWNLSPLIIAAITLANTRILSLLRSSALHFVLSLTIHHLVWMLLIVIDSKKVLGDSSTSALFYVWLPLGTLGIGLSVLAISAFILSPPIKTEK